MTGWNLPPGCSVRDLPGNSQADQDAEAFFDAMWEVLPDALTDDQKNALCEWAFTKLGEAYSAGYQDGQKDAALASPYA